MLMQRIEQGMSTAYYAQHHGEQPAVIEVDRVTNFAQLNAYANQLVRALRQRGLKAGDAVALLCSNRLEFVTVIIALERSGLRMTPINTHLTGDEVGYILDNCEAKAFIAESRYAAQAQAAATLAKRAEVKFAIGGDISGFEAYDNALSACPDHDIDDPTLGSRMLYTSGTTGRPKGVYRDPAYALPSVMTSVELANAAGYQCGTGQLHLCAGPLYHAAPLGYSLAQPLLAGVGLVLMNRWNSEEALRLIQQHRITHTHMVPTMFHRLLSLPQDIKDKYDLSSLQFVIHGAAPCSVQLKTAMIKWWGPILSEYYAATEGRAVSVTSTEWLRRPGTVGKPNPIEHVRILDEHAQALPPNTAGTIYIKAPAIGRFNYFKDDSKTASSYRGDYFTLGDIGYLDEDGWLFLTDRNANLIISGGVNIYPQEIENVLLQHPKVMDAAVVGVPNSDWGEEVKAVVQPVHAGDIGPALAAELQAFCRERLASYKVPKSFDYVDAFPLVPSGKISKKDLRDLADTFPAV